MKKLLGKELFSVLLIIIMVLCLVPFGNLTVLAGNSNTDVVSLNIKNCSCMCGTGGYFDKDPVTGQEYYRYSIFEIDATVVLRNGSVIETKSRLFNYGDRFYSINIVDEQSFENAWGVGNHEVTASVDGVFAKFNFQIYDSGVTDIIVDDTNLYKDIDGYIYENEEPFFLYVYEPEFTVVLRDGTEIKSNNQYVQIGDSICYSHISDDQFDNHWQLGRHTIRITVAGFTKEIDFNVIDWEYEKIEIVGDNDLKIMLFKPGGEIVEESAISIDVRAGDIGLAEGYLITESHKYHTVFNWYADNDEREQCDKDVVLSIGDNVSNTLNKCTWLKAQILNCNYLAAAIGYRAFDSEFSDFTINNFNIDDIIILAANIYGVYHAEEFMGGILGHNYAIMKKNDIDFALKEYFGIENIDYKLYSKYDENNPDKIKVIDIRYGTAFPERVLDFSNNKWQIEYSEYEIYVLGAQRITITTDDKFRIEEISFTTGSDKPGDINGDYEVDNKDLTRLFQYLSNWDVYVNEAALDVNGDESVDNKDLTRLFQYLSNWDVEIF